MADPQLTYKDAGVDIDAGNALVERLKPIVAGTRRPEVLAGLGGFGGLFELGNRYREPVLVAGTDGVGTKLLLAQALKRHDTIGQDLVAMCVNDILVQGAEPLFFLDYFACGTLDGDIASTVIAGIANGCKLAGAALIGGETAEMPDLYGPDEYDLAGFAVGVVEKSAVLDGRAVAEGDALIALASSGPHANGYSLIRKVLERDPSAEFAGRAAVDQLLEPTRIYVQPVRELLAAVDVRALAHITGGGLSENLPRIMPDGLAAAVDTATLEPGPVFKWLASVGNITASEMRRTFNLGVGMVAVIDERDIDKTLTVLRGSGERAWQIGTVVRGRRGVAYV